MYVLAAETNHLVIADVYPLSEARVISRTDLKQYTVRWTDMLVSVSLVCDAIRA